MSWGLTIVLATVVAILLFALVRHLYGSDGPANSTDTRPKHDLKACAFCGRPHESTARLKECTGCRALRYCSEACQTHDWQNHKAFCRYMQDQRKTSYHDALVIPAEGGPAVLRKLVFSVDGVCHPAANFLRVVDLREIFRSDTIQDTRYHRIQVKNQGELVDGDYVMYYTISPNLPLNEHLLRAIREKDEIPQDRHFWHGDVVIVKLVEKFRDRPDEFEWYSGPPEVDYVDVPKESLPVVQHWMQKFYDIGFDEAIKHDEEKKSRRAVEEKS